MEALYALVQRETMDKSEILKAGKDRWCVSWAKAPISHAPADILDLFRSSLEIL
ncbi:hypothetical protein sscle_06g053190 [Sclerotinia sclerotiorum 1980 UF-70]|uniref:Uncharacterized protein n=1 Tax=Sclerotinia sclerotiorum (strain ATCC 18683 / 1980 / Ss-1) TaxID=665079 RepID=A0A1D9Q6N1_SCLS1|nr:hypothetical protein sscle_06g053190 [Sclerotinia sclerotiorum 1980 UF-70]